MRALFATLTAATVALLASCGSSSDDPARGQLIVMVTSDMPVPKDITSIELKVFATRDAQFDTLQYDGALETDKLQLPASLALVAGADVSKPVKVRVEAWQGSPPNRRLRVVQERVTTPPASGNFVLEMPLQWLCDGRATVVPPDNIDIGCQEGFTCFAGVCESNFVDPATLPEYGGDYDLRQHDADGCFDAVECFSGSSLVGFVDLSSCTIDYPDAMAVEQGVNVAIGLKPNSDGFCSSERCYIVLDFGSVTGWNRVDKKIQLPKHICTSIGEGNADIAGVAVSTTCKTKTPSWDLCQFR
jgi:hypothetical protein